MSHLPTCRSMAYRESWIYSTGTVHDNIAYGVPDTTREDVEEAARMANCDFIWQLPQGFDTQSMYWHNALVVRILITRFL